MADLGFLPAVKRLLDQTPQRGQRLLFSATLDGGVDVLVKRFLHDPVTHSVDSAQSPVATMTHHVLHVEHASTGSRSSSTWPPRRAAPSSSPAPSTAQEARPPAQRAGVPAVELHGNLAQNARTRNLAAFSAARPSTLVATDIAARGIHVDDVAWSSTPTRRSSTRPTCTAPAVRRAPAPPAPSSR